MTFAKTTVTEPLTVSMLKYNVLNKGETVHHAEEQKFTHLLLFSSSAHMEYHKQYPRNFIPNKNVWNPNSRKIVPAKLSWRFYGARQKKLG